MRADGQGRISELLDGLYALVALLALVFVGGHHRLRADKLISAVYRSRGLSLPVA